MSVGDPPIQLCRTCGKNHWTCPHSMADVIGHENIVITKPATSYEVEGLRLRVRRLEDELAIHIRECKS